MSEQNSEPLIAFDAVSKKFRRGELHDSLRDLIPAMVGSVFRQSPADEMKKNEFWALQDVSFKVGPGEALGIIGPNGAGKSTVLKILTRILRPNRGNFVLRGRVGALIEVAAGFHPDLTGRENVFLQGAVMGMSKGQISGRFDEIVAFSGVEDAIDTPIKRYSSGMNARLGFAIAAHLDPDVLIIDEVLAVGDFAYQQKAFARIKAMVTSGIPVVIVSHQLDRIAELCTEALVLDCGRVVHHGSPSECIAEYFKPQNQTSQKFDGPTIVTFDRFVSTNGEDTRSGERLGLVVEGQLFKEADLERIDPVVVRVRSAQSGTTIFVCGTSTCGIEIARGRFILELSLEMNVQAGIYIVDVLSYDRKAECLLAAGPSLTVMVREGPIFIGTIQLNAQMKTLPPGLSGADSEKRQSSSTNAGANPADGAILQRSIQTGGL
jgi:ABC-type polysaccharide/polyol phosphate transport system ATPase subunit